MIEVVKCRIPVIAGAFGQLGASSPVTMAGCLTQTTAKTLAGIVITWLIEPSSDVIFGLSKVKLWGAADLRIGSITGGSGEQVTFTAASMQIAR